MDIPNVPGIYQITDTITGATYVGASKAMRDRISWHFKDMVRKPHLSTYRTFANTLRAHGKAAFSISVVQTCAEPELASAEVACIERLKPSENSYLCADGRRVYTADTRARKAEAAARLWATEDYRAKAVAARAGNAYNAGYKCTPAQVANRQRAGRISNMRRKHGDGWMAAYVVKYPEFAGDIHA